jgi:iron complex transport system substrate-binding protein
VEAPSYTRYSKGFRIDTVTGFKILSITNPWAGHVLTQRILLVDSLPKGVMGKIPDSLQALPRLKIPLRRIVALSSTHLALLADLQALDRVVGVSRHDLIISPTTRENMARRKVPQVGYGPSIQVEQVLELEPDAVFTFGTGDSKFDDYSVLQEAHLPVLVLSEWLESHPLGRLEWIRLLGILLKQENLADSIFLDRANRYDSLLRIAHKLPDLPTVMTGLPQGETWYMTGGRNYFAQFLRDAKAKYYWNENLSQGSLKSSVEQVLATAQHADYWLNPGTWNTRAEALAEDPRVMLFDSWKKGQVYQHNKSDFWELGMTRPDLVLADLIAIFHPNSLPAYPTTFYQLLQ